MEQTSSRKKDHEYKQPKIYIFGQYLWSSNNKNTPIYNNRAIELLQRTITMANTKNDNTLTYFGIIMKSSLKHSPSKTLWKLMSSHQFNLTNFATKSEETVWQF